MPVLCSIPSACCSSKHPQLLCFMLHHHNTQNWHHLTGRILRTIALRHGTSHTIVTPELNEKQEKSDTMAGASCRPVTLNLARAEIFHIQLYTNAK